MVNMRLGTTLLSGFLGVILAIVLASVSTTDVVFPATGDIDTVAGSGVGDDGVATNAGFSRPSGVVVDASGNLFIADEGNHRIRRVDFSTGVITTFAGNGSGKFSGDGGQATSARLRSPTRLALDSSGNLYIADRSNHRIRRVDAVTGVIITVAGDGNDGFSGDFGPAISASLDNPSGIAVDQDGNLYIADRNNHRIRIVIAGADGQVDGDADDIITTVAGDGNAGFTGDGVLSFNTSLNRPHDVALGPSGHLYIADRDNHRIRRIDHFSDIITTVAGDGTADFSGDEGAATSASLFRPEDVALDDAGNLYITDTRNNRIRKVTAGLDSQVDGDPDDIITTVAGDGASGFTGDGGLATSASLSFPQGVALDASGNLFIADRNNRVRQVASSTGVIDTFAGGFTGEDGPATNAVLSRPQGLVVDTFGNLFFADGPNNLVRRVDVSTGIITTVAGNGSFSSSGNFGPATSAGLRNPTDVALDAAGNLYIADRNNNRIRKVTAGADGQVDGDADDIITTVAGDGSFSFSGDFGPATNASLQSPSGVAVDGQGNLYIADRNNNRIRKVTAGADGQVDGDADDIITTVAGDGIDDFFGDGLLATEASLDRPEDIALDAAGNLFIADTRNRRVRRVDVTTGIIATVAGNGSGGLCGDAGPASSSCVEDPIGVALDVSGNLYIADKDNNRIRMVTPGVDGQVDGDSDDIITTVAGSGPTQGFGNFTGDGGPATSATLLQPEGVAVDPMGGLFISDTGNNRIRKVEGTSPAPPGPKVRFNPETIDLSNIGDSVVITVEALEVPAEVDGIQINLQNPPNLSVSNPGCVDLFGGGVVIGTVPVSGGGVLVGCALLGGDVNGPPDGDAMTFQLTQNGACTEEVLTFGFGGPEGTQFSEAGILLIATGLNQLNIQCGVDVRSDPLTNGVQLQICPAPPCGFHALDLVMVTLTGSSFDQTIPVGDDGQWTFEGVQPGVYTLTATSPGHLSREKEVVVGVVDVTVEDPAPLLAGDVVPTPDGDQFVNINDVSALTSQFGQQAVDCHASEDALLYIDLDCSGFININDLSVVASNFIQGGSRPWMEP